MNDPELLIEEFDYNEAYQLTNYLYPLIIAIIVLSYVLVVISLMFIPKSKQKMWSSILFTLLLLPTGITQIIAIILSICLLIYYKKPKHFMNLQLFIIGSIFYVVTSYIIVLLLLFLFGNMNLYEYQNKEFFQNESISLDTLTRKNIIAKKHESKIIEQGRVGKENVKNKKIVFGMLAKNGIKHMNNMKKKINILGKQFQDYMVLIFENDSNDGTRNALYEWQAMDSHVQILTCCDLGTCECKLGSKDPKSFGYTSSSRSHRMAYFRQRILSTVQSEYQEWDYFMMLDFDLSGAFYIDGFLTTFHRDDWDAVFANGIAFIPLPFLHTVPFNYDCFAFDDKTFQQKNQINHFFIANGILRPYVKKMEWYKAVSGFNGAMIYKISSLQNASYTPVDNLLCEHKYLHYSMQKNGYGRIFYNPAMILFAGQQCEPRLQMLLKTLRLH